MIPPPLLRQKDGTTTRPTEGIASEARKQRVLTQHAAAIVAGIADAVVIKDDNVFFVCEPNGLVPLAAGHGLGLYYHDCRYLSGYEISIAGHTLQPLAATAHAGYAAVLELTNPEIDMGDGRSVRMETVGVTWRRLVDGDSLGLHDELTLRNYGDTDVDLEIDLRFRAGFEDVFAIRSLLREQPGRHHHPEWNENRLRFRYDGADGVIRTLDVAISPQPVGMDRSGARCRVQLAPGQTHDLEVQLSIAERDADRVDHAAAAPRISVDVSRLRREAEADQQRWMEKTPSCRSDSLVLNRLMERSFLDIRLLRSSLGDEEYTAAGLPWFGTLFGRDSLIAALQVLAYEPELAEETLRLLARRQGRRVDAWRDEQPGKILHELRIGELAKTGEIPHTPYYGTVDATPLFLVLLAQHAAWTGQLRLFAELREPVELALEWLTSHGDADGDGYVEYESSIGRGLVNQGWKDSGDAIVTAEGRLADPPIALIEVQAYAYMARVCIADVYHRAGDVERAERLRKEAEELRRRVDRDFWMDGNGIYEMALQAGNRGTAVVASNAGHALWAGIAVPEKARRTMERLMAKDMFSGWGIRTLSENERRYNPIGYHLGTVWPHENAMIAAGFRRYGFDEAAGTIFTGLVEAATTFEHYRLPELLSGFPREEYGVPVRYPVACHPQAWAAGAIPHLLTGLLGLAPEAFERRLRVVRPVMPSFADFVELSGLRVGEGRVDLRFERTDDAVSVEVLHVEGDVEVVVEPRALPDE